MDDRSNVVEAVFAQRRAVEEPDEYQALVCGRIGTRPQPNLLAWKADGEVRGFAYADWSGVHSHNPDVGFTVSFGNQVLRIEGRNLTKLFQYVCTYRAAEIEEVDQPRAMRVADDEPVVWLLRW